MKRRFPFNEIRSMGYIIEGMHFIEIPIQKVAPSSNKGSYSGSKPAHHNPEIKDDEELLKILSEGLNEKWDLNRLSRLRSGIGRKIFERNESDPNLGYLIEL